MNHRIFRDNVWITLVPHPDTDGDRINIDEYEQRIKLALLELENLKAREPDLEVRFYTDYENGFEINTAFGMQTITVHGFPEEVVVEEEEEKGLEANFESYVLLVEMGDAPGAFAVFAPVGEGHGPAGGMGANMSFVGWTNNISANQDPPGLVGQATNRAGWCDDPAPPPSADHPGAGYIQIVRVDQGWRAYPGDWGNPTEVTALRDEYVWTYEGIPFTNHWESVEPGPPPESLCGYTWSIEPNYGGDDSGEFHDTRHLFYGVETSGKFQAWWPPEFNQLITIKQYWHEETILSPWWAGWELTGYSTYIGLDAWYGQYAIPASFGKVSHTVNDTRRSWGLIDNWGNYAFDIEDYYTAEFPFTEWGPVWREKAETKTDYATDWCNAGIHVADAWDRFALAGGLFWPSDRAIEYHEGWQVGKRRGWTKEEQMSGIVENGEAWPYWTERMGIILEGNADSAEWTLNPYTNIETASEWTRTRDAYIMGILAGGAVYYVIEEAPENHSGCFCDYGIFTKKGTGIDPETGEVDPATIEPIYAYSMKTGTRKPDSTSFATDGIIYGMIIDGEHYMTENFPYLGGGSPVTWDVNGGDFGIPGAETAKDSDGNPVTAKPRVRVGLMLQYYPDTTINTGD